MKNKKGFTLVELLAVIVVLGIIMILVGRGVVESVNQSRERVKFLAAKEITEIAEAYISTETNNDYVEVKTLIDNGFLKSDVTNPLTGKSDGNFENQIIRKSSTVVPQNDYEVKGCSYLYERKCYRFDGYVYYLN